MDKQQYGSEYNGHLLKQYELFVNGMDKISDRRDRANTFYTTVLAGLLVIVSTALTAWGPEGVLPNLLMSLVGVIGVFLCAVWRRSIESYRQLNDGKFQVIHEMEENLPFRCYAVEWEKLGEGKDHRKYRPFTKLEKTVPIIVAIPYALLVLYGVIRLIVALVHFVL